MKLIKKLLINFIMNLVEAAIEGNIERIDHLLRSSTIDIDENNGEALRYASFYGHLNVVNRLIEAGANIHAENDRAIQWASSNGHINIVKRLIEAGADIRANN